MKFTNGQWLVRDGFAVYGPSEARSVEIGRDSFTVYAPCKHVRHRADTLGGVVLTVTFSSPMPDVIRVQAAHHSGRLPKGPDFALDLGNPPVEITDSDASICLKSGETAVEVRKSGGWKVAFKRGGRQLTASSARGMAWVKDTSGGAWMREMLELSVGECVYGMGERFTNFIKNGQTVEIWNKDGGTSSDQAYKNIPFYLTNRGYGVLVNTPDRVCFEVATETVSKVQFGIPGECLDYFLIGGETLKDVLGNYAKLTGRPALPPAWSFGLWLTTSFTTDYDEKTVAGFIDGMAERGIPLQVFHFDCFWMKEQQWCDFEWDGETFPDPKAMLGRMKERGLKVCVWINPYIAQRSKLFTEGMEKGYLLHDREGNVWQWDMWQAGMGLVDFTNPDAAAWYQSKLKALLDMGVDCFKTDFGERIPTDVRYHDGSDAERMHNYYTYLYNKAVFELLVRERGAGDALVFARSATVGCQQFPVHWGGDNTATFASMAESLRGGLSLGLSGFGFWAHDIGGFEETATPDLYKRWAAFGLLSSHSRLHGNSSYRVPWLFDEEAVDVLRFFTRLKCSLMPYIYASAVETAKTGLPMMRPMVLEFMGDPAVDALDRQYMLGGSLLVAPVFSETGDAAYYLPAGSWTNILTGERKEGGRWLAEKHGYMSLPLMARPGSLIPIGSNCAEAEYDYAYGVSLHLFELADGCSARAAVCSPKGEQELEVTAKREGDIISVVSIGARKPWSLVLRGVHAAKGVQGAALQDGEQGIVATPDTPSGAFSITL